MLFLPLKNLFTDFMPIKTAWRKVSANFSVCLKSEERVGTGTFKLLATAAAWRRTGI